MAKKTGLPLVHLDRLFWTGPWQHLTPEEFDPLLLEQLEKPAWIIDGNFNRTIPLRLRYCDTVIYLDLPRTACICGVLQRVIRYHGQSRPDMGKECREHLDLAFLRQVWEFPGKHRKNYYALLEQASHARKIILRSRRQVNDFLKTL